MADSDDTPEKPLPLGRRKMKRYCTGKNNRGQPCGRPPIRGGNVCLNHGGGLPRVRAKANQRLRELLAEAIDPDNSMREAARLAYSDIRRIFDEDGRLLPMKKWPEDIARCVSSCEIVKGNVDAGDGMRDTVIKLRLWDKGKALENLMKHHGQLTEKVEHTGSLVIEWQK
jgi:hypothetical protein